MNLAATGHPSLAARVHPHEEGSDAVFHVTIVASGHGLLKMVFGKRLRFTPLYEDMQTRLLR